MKKFFIFIVLTVFLCIIASLFAVSYFLFTPKTMPQNYRIEIQQGDNWRTVATKLKKDQIIDYETPFVLFSRFHRGKLNKGTFGLSGSLSTAQIVQYLDNATPEKISFRIPEGFTFNQIQLRLNHSGSLKNKIEDLNQQQILNILDSQNSSSNLEGWLFPDTYIFNGTPSELDIYKIAYQTMQKHLNNAWQNRDENLPYQSPYELLIMASIIEKETGHKDDRALVAAVFVNRLKKNMRLQTDPTVIYGMGEKYQGKIHKADLQTDTPYNTYTRHGLPPTPIAAPSLASIEAAAHPAAVDYLYFVAKADGTGRSQFSHSLNEHNAAVREHILKK